MKLISFLCWKYRRFTLEDKLWSLGTFLIIFGFFIHSYFFLSGIAIWFGILFNTFIIAKYKKDYTEFKEEQNKLFETIKQSDQK